MASKSVWGIDIGQVALKAIRLTKNEQGQPVVQAYEVIEHSKILSQPDVDTEMADGLIREALEKFVARQDVLKTDVVTGVPGNQTFARFTKLPPVEPKQVPSIVEFEAGQQIPFPMEEVVWDYQTFQEKDSPDIEVGIFAIKREIVAKHLAYYKTVSLNPTIIQMNPMALYNFAGYDGQLAEGGATVILNVGADSSDLVIGDGERIWQRTFPMGGNAFTTALVNSFKLSFTKAEALKRTSDQSKYGRQVFQAMKPAFSDILTEINKSVGYYTQMHRDSQIKKFLLVGNTFKVPGLVKFLEQSLSGEVVQIKHFGKLAPGGLASTPGFIGHAGSLTIAYGLALQGLDLVKIQSNLLPSEQARELLWQRKTFWFLSSAACLGLAGGVLWASNTLNQKRYEDQSKVRSEYQNVLNEAQAVRSQFETVRIAGQDETAQIIRIEDLQTPQVKALIPKIYDVVMHSLPEHPAMKAQNTADYIAKLSQEPRKQRQIIVIDDLIIRYVPNWDAGEGIGGGAGAIPGIGSPMPGGGPPMGGPMGMPAMGMPSGPEQTGAPGEQAKPAKPGFEVIIIGRSPYEKLNNLLANDFIAKLLDLGNKTDLPFSVDKEKNPIQWIKPLKETVENLNAEIPGLTSGMPSSEGAVSLDVGPGTGHAPMGGGLVSEKDKVTDPLFPEEDKSEDKLFKLNLRIYIKNPATAATLAPNANPS